VLHFARDLPDHGVQSIVLLKVTYEADRQGALVPAREPMPIVQDILETPFGVFHTEMIDVKDGADIGVLGTVRRSQSVTALRLALRVNQYPVADLLVVGDRRWVQTAHGLMPSEPTPFHEMPLSYRRAFGGRTEWDHEPNAWPENPDGVGYYLNEAQAEGKPLPNFEASQGPRIAKWSDRPPVAGWGPYPFLWSLRALEGVVPQGTADRPLMPQLRNCLYNNAHPSLVVRALSPGDVIQIDGMYDTPIAWRLPFEQLVLDVRIGEEAPFQAVGTLDGAWLWCDVGKLTLTHRARFNYRFRRGEVRSIRTTLRSWSPQA